MRTSVTLLAAVLSLAGGPPTARHDGKAPLGEEALVDLFDELPVPFVIESTEAGEEGRLVRLRSAEPTGRTASGALYLRATVTVAGPADAATAEAEIERRLAAADPDLGLSYAWDYVVAVDGSIAHLHAGCTFSQDSFEKVALALERALTGAGAGPPASFWCRCGGGCRAGAPFAPAGGDRRRVPPVRRPDGVEQGEYDNRLDPSGSWTSAIGDLSLMHHANRLAFSYSAVFGPTAHICEGAGVAGLVGTDRYEYPDEQGTVTFFITETGVRMELTEGIASFCGAGWAGDRFTTDRFEPPAGCRVAAEHTHVHVVDTLDLGRTPFSIGQGSPLEAAPARHTGDEAWVLARSVGSLTTTMGLVARGTIDCPTAPAAGAGR